MADDNGPDMNEVGAGKLSMFVGIDDVEGEEDDDVEHTAVWKATDGPRTATHSLCEPAPSKCKSTTFKSHSVQRFATKKREG